MILLYFGSLKPASTSFFFLTFSGLQYDFCHKNRICFCRGHLSPSNYHSRCTVSVLMLFHPPWHLTPVTSSMKPPSPWCPAPHHHPAVRSFHCPSLHELPFSHLLPMYTSLRLLGKKSLSLYSPLQWLHPFSHLQPFSFRKHSGC